MNSVRLKVNPKIFKTYDIRGIYPTDINGGVATEIGRGLGRFFGKKKKPKVIVARDGRIGSPELCRGLKEGLKSGGSKIKIVDVGLATTPMLYILVQLLEATGGVIATASHNPKEWNGFKVVGKNAEMIGGKEVLKIMNGSL